MQNVLKELKAAALMWYECDADHMASSVSYYSLFGLVPLTLLTLLLSSVLFGRAYVSVWFIELGSVFGDGTVALLSRAISNLELQTTSFAIPIVGTIFFCGMAIVMLNTFTTGLHRLWSLPHRGVRGWVCKCRNSIVFIIILQLFVMSMLIMQYLTEWLFAGFMSALVIAIVNFSLITLLISLMYGVLPWEAPSVSARLYGATVAAVLFMIAKLFVTSYVSMSPFPGLFGGAGFLIVLLIWVYATVSILYFGAAVAQVRATLQSTHART